MRESVSENDGGEWVSQSVKVTGMSESVSESVCRSGGGE